MLERTHWKAKNEPVFGSADLKTQVVQIISEIMPPASTNGQRTERSAWKRKRGQLQPAEPNKS
ncbi:MAG: hypothetical protein JPMHGGIA_02272 [Saprospiraceae bacterium]|jgi:hypothetical protein|nr:hypothetical protein [Saprospiraceae bacterium]